MMKYFLLLAFTMPTFASEAEIQMHLDKVTHKDTVTRLEKFSSSFVGLPYGKGGPLGEGPQGRYDQDPLYRFDTFDCTTFVETIISLALSWNASEFLTQMDKIRYEDSQVDYLKRNHFPSLQWIPNNIANGMLREINDLILPKKNQLTARAVINLPGWLKNIKIEEIKAPYATAQERQDLLEELKSMSQYYSPVEASLQYISIKTLVANPSLLKKIPHGSIVNLVRPNWDLTTSSGTHMNVSHQGFIFQIKGVTYMRHASTTGKVMNDKFIDYLKRFENHATLKGVHFMQLASSQI